MGPFLRAVGAVDPGVSLASSRETQGPGEVLGIARKGLVKLKSFERGCVAEPEPDDGVDAGVPDPGPWPLEPMGLLEPIGFAGG